MRLKVQEDEYIDVVPGLRPSSRAQRAAEPT